MAFRFKKASCVAVGTFNMYIVQPAWLAKPEIGIIPEGTEVAIETKLDAPGFRFTSPKLPATWIVTPSRIVLETENPAHNCGETMAQVLKALPWTPLVALGTNTLYEGSLNELDGAPEVSSYPLATRKPDDFELAQRSFHVALKKDELVFNLQLSVRNDAAELSANAHTDLQNRDSEFAQEAARKFLDHRRLAESLIADIFKVSIEHASSNA